MIYQKTPKDKTKSKYKYVHSFSIFVGSISTLLGIGGGTLTTPYFNFHGEDIKRSIATASACGVLIASVAIVSILIQNFIFERNNFPSDGNDNEVDTVKKDNTHDVVKITEKTNSNKAFALDTIIESPSTSREASPQKISYKDKREQKGKR